MDIDCTPHCPLPNIGPCVGERCNYWDPDQGCLGVGIAFGADPSFGVPVFSEIEDNDSAE
jgi:hypothetical protein